jgi:hypothetical protein
MSDDFVTFLMFISAVWLIAASVAVGLAAKKRGGSMAAWLFASLLLSPFLAALLLIAYLIPGSDREAGEYCRTSESGGIMSISPR